MIVYTQPLQLDISNDLVHDGELNLIDHQHSYGPEKEYSDWELRIKTRKHLPHLMPATDVLIAKYTNKEVIAKLVEFLRDPQEMFRQEDQINEEIYETKGVNLSDDLSFGGAIRLNRYNFFKGTTYEYTFYCEYHAVHFSVGSYQLKDCFPEVLTRIAINAL
jgi:hypothetical protein